MNLSNPMLVCYLGNEIPVDPPNDIYRFMGQIDADLNLSNPRPWYVFAPGIDEGFHSLAQAYRYATFELDLPPFEHRESMYTEQCTWLEDHGVSYDYHMSAAAAEQLIYETLSA